jgi:hypothetical protein
MYPKSLFVEIDTKTFTGEKSSPKILASPVILPKNLHTQHKWREFVQSGHPVAEQMTWVKNKDTCHSFMLMLWYLFAAYIVYEVQL